MKRMGLILCGVVLATSAMAQTGAKVAGKLVAAKADAADWPQWRGPNRDGVALSSPKLLDSWPTNGPRLVWTSAPIPSNQKGGAGSPVVANGKVFLYVEEPRKTGAFSLTTKQLQEWGWDESITPELAAKVDETRKKWWGKKHDEQEAIVNEFLGTLDPAVVAKLGGAIRSNLWESWTTRFDWTRLLKLATLRDKEFTFQDELNSHSEIGLLINAALLKNQYTYYDTLICLDAATGKELWRQAFPDGLVSDPRWRGYCASSTPAVSDGRCFVAGSAGLFSVSITDGTLLWRTPTNMFGGSSPLVVQTVVYQNTDKGLLALNAVDGKLLWKQPEVKTYGSSVALWPHAGTNYLLALGWDWEGSSLNCVEAETGKVLWRTGHCYGKEESTPVVSGDTALVYYPWGIAAFALSTTNGTERWKQGNGIASGDSSPVIFKDHVYVCAGQEMTARGMWCGSLATGAMKWKRTVEWAGTSSPLLVDGKIIAYVAQYAKNGPGGIVMFKATPEKFEELGFIDGSGKGLCSMSSPAVANGKLFVRQNAAVACYDLTGK